jgi:hypothetical protein
VDHTEWATCGDPLRMLDAIRDTAPAQQLRQFAVICCEPLLAVLDEDGRRAVRVAARLARGQATESERAEAESGVFQLEGYQQDLDRFYDTEDYEAAGYPQYSTDPWFAATDAAAGAVAADPWLGACVAARSALEAAGKDGRAAEQSRLCAALRFILK